MKLFSLGVLLGSLIATSACGGGGSSSSTGNAAASSGPLSGNWQIALNRHANPGQPLTYTGFLIQSGDSISGNLILGSGSVGLGCSGVGSVAGTVNQQNVSLTIDEFGEDVSLMGTMPTSSAPMSGEFSNLAGGCTSYPNTGTWLAFPVAAINGNFHGTLMSTSADSGSGTVNIAGTLTQGPNTGGSTATLAGTVTETGAPPLCNYLSTATITGEISGTSLALNFYAPDGSLITQIGELGQFGNPQDTAAQLTVTADGTSMTGMYTFPAIASTSCTGDTGNFQITFP